MAGEMVDKAEREDRLQESDRDFSIRDVQATRKELEIKANINDIQQLCMDMEGEKAARCLTTAQKFDDEMTETLRRG